MASEDTWRMATGEDDGKPLVIRIRERPPSFVRKKAFAYMLALCWKYTSRNRRGMPSPKTLERMEQLEDLLMPAFEGARQAFLTVVVTGNGVREWQWYARTPEDTMLLVNETLGPLEPFPVAFNFQADPDWDAYTRFLDIVNEQTE
jgi:hypothetical protein